MLNVTSMLYMLLLQYLNQDTSLKEIFNLSLALSFLNKVIIIVIKHLMIIIIQSKIVNVVPTKLIYMIRMHEDHTINLDLE